MISFYIGTFFFFVLARVSRSSSTFVLQIRPVKFCCVFVQLQYGVDESYKLTIPGHGTQVYAHIEVSVNQC